MDRVILSEKMESLRRCILHIEEKKPPGLEGLINSEDTQDILVLNLTRAVQLCVDIGSHIVSESNEAAPRSMGEVFSILQDLGVISTKTCTAMRKAVGFRNVAVHNDEAINWEIVFAICEKSLDDFRTFAQDIHHHLSF